MRFFKVSLCKYKVHSCFARIARHAAIALTAVIMSSSMYCKEDKAHPKAILSIEPSDGRKKIIAHRGYWTKPGSTENSLSSLANAIELGVYGSEIDVYVTTDNVVVLNHCPEFQGVVIEQSAFADLAGLRLSNGEPLPTLQQCIDLVKNQHRTKLIIEIKPHTSLATENRAVAAVLKAVNDNGVAHLVDYISFSRNICEQLIKAGPQNRVALLAYWPHEAMTPRQLKEAGYWGMNYHYDLLKSNPVWISEAKELGLETMVWTVNYISHMQFFIDSEIEVITTDLPTKLKELIVQK